MYFPTLILILSIFVLTTVFASEVSTRELDTIFSDVVDLDKYTKNQKRIILRTLKNQESFLDRWCRPQGNNSTLKYIVCEGFQVEKPQ